MFHDTLKAVLAILLASLIAGCSQTKSGSENHPAFCEVGRPPVENEKVYYDLENMKAYVANGAAGNYDLTFISEQDYLGFRPPIHLLVPTPEALARGEPLNWTTDGYNFTVEKAPQQKAGWYLVRSRIISEPDNTGATTGPKMGKRAQIAWHIGADVLFSVQSGVVAYQDIAYLAGNVTYREFYLCSEAKMDLHALRRE